MCCLDSNENLEKQAQAIFKNWFIDFEFPNEERQPYKSSGGKMIWNEELQKEIPEGWKNGITDEVIEILDFKRIPLSNHQRAKMQKIYPYYGATSLMDYVDNYIFDGIYLLIGEDGTVIDDNGYPILQYIFGKFWVNNHAHVLKGKNGFSVEELFLFFKNINIKTKITGSVQQKLNQSNLKNISLTIPSLEVLSKFDIIIQPMFKFIRNNTLESKQLADLRDTLLPRLMSGELDVSNVKLKFQSNSHLFSY